MKFIVKSDFYRTPQLAEVEIGGAAKIEKNGKPVLIDGKAIELDIEPPHANHFHTGAIIELGKSANESELQTTRTDNAETKKLIAQLRYCGRIGDAADKDVVSRVVDDVIATKTREAQQAKLARQADNAGVMRSIEALINKALMQPAK